MNDEDRSVPASKGKVEGWHVEVTWELDTPKALSCLRLSTFVTAGDLYHPDEANAVAWFMSVHAAPIARALGASADGWCVENVEAYPPQEAP